VENFAHPLTVVEDPKKKQFVIPGLKEVVVDSFKECLDLLKLGERNRSYAETAMNHVSSRSHTLYRLTVDSMPQLAPEDLGIPHGDSPDRKS
jgi:hypothetical protein